MASITQLSAADIREQFLKDAVLFVEDPAIGEQVNKMHDRNFPIESLDGLDFYQQNVRDDQVCRLIPPARYV